MDYRTFARNPWHHVPLIWIFFQVFLLHSCASFWDEAGERQAAKKLEEAQAEERSRAEAILRDALEREERAKREREATAAKMLKEETDLKAAIGMSAVARRRAIASCVKGDDCPIEPATLLRAAKDPNEAAALAAHQERIQASVDRASASLLCADGTESPTCTCGRPRRGCCSRHGGVVGCAADVKNH